MHIEQSHEKRKKPHGETITLRTIATILGAVAFTVSLIALLGLPYSEVFQFLGATCALVFGYYFGRAREDS